MSQRPDFIASIFSPSDEHAMWRVQTQDDPAAFAVLVGRWEQPILRLCARMTGDTGRAEDLKQDAFARVFTKRRDFQAGMRFSTWLWRIALNLCYDELRKVQRRGESLLVASEDGVDEMNVQPSTSSAAPDAQASAAEESELVRAELLQLQEHSRSVLVLRFCEALKLREVGEILDLPESTVRYRLAEGLTQLTRLLEPAFGRPVGAARALVPDTL
jgi:RNA polymerase sigma-70 factor (ECF subfamily)